MSYSFNILWIDDNPRRNKEARNMEVRLKIKVKFIDVKGKDLPGELNQILSQDEPDLILMDHMLRDVNVGGFDRGSTATEVIREKWTDCPIVCITAIPLKDIDFHKQSIYEDVFEFDNISFYDSALISIAASFQMLKKKRPKNVNDFIAALNPPGDEYDRLKSVLPKTLKDKDFYTDESLFMSISRWVRHTLLLKPGFLYDRLWASTLMGLKEESFGQVEHLFKEAKYSGIFADKSNERWWQSKLREILYSIVPDSDLIYPWELGRKLPGFTESDFSKCYASGENYPDTVAYIDESSNKKAPMRLRYTVSHPNFEKSLFFEEIKMMKGHDDD